MLRKLYIEPTTKCNLNCKMCFRHTWFDEPICDLRLEDFRRALDTMPPSVETIFFGGMGEPLFHRDILQMVRLAAETGAEVELLTNGTLLSEQMIRGLIDAGLCKLWVSIDDLQTDSSIDGSGHGHAGQVLSNIRRFNRIRQQHGAALPWASPSWPCAAMSTSLGCCPSSSPSIWWTRSMSPTSLPPMKHPKRKCSTQGW